MNEGTTMALIDTHFHVWDPAVREQAWLAEEPELNQRFGIEDFEAVARRNGVTGAVLVQVLNHPGETREFLAIAAEHEIVSGVVGWAPIESPQVGEEIAALRSSPGGDRLVAVRHLVQDEPDDAYAARPSVAAGVRAVAEAGLAYDVLVRAHQLPAAVALAQATEGCRLVLDHGAKPPFGDAEALETWERRVAELAGMEHVSCKLSGFITEAGPHWRDVDVRRCLAHLVECFGPGRLMYGSNWPVCAALAGYDEILELCRSALGGLSAGEQEAVMSGNARRTYGLDALPVRGGTSSAGGGPVRAPTAQQG